MIAALAKQGPVRLHLTLTPKTLPEEQSYNVIADLKGAVHPEQVIIVSGHLDSWDLGTGAIDDGAGVVAAMQVVNLIKQLGLKPARTIRVVAWMDEDALARTLETREATYFSRSRNEQWVKGLTSGHTQRVHSVRLDCDGDAVLLEVSARGGALEKILGDQALAVFYGDDHLTQALRAALSLQTRHPELSQGVDSGPLWAGSVGSSTYSRMDFTVCGPIVRSAQELCARARPGQVLVRRELEPFLVRRFSVTPIPHTDPGDPDDASDANDPKIRAGSPLGHTTVAVCAVNPVRGPSSQEHTRALSPIPLGALVSDSG